MKRILLFLLILISFVSCNNNKTFVRYTDEEFAKENNGGIVISKGQSSTASEKLVYTIGLKSKDTTWTVYGVSKNVYKDYELGDTVKYVAPVEKVNESKSIVTINGESHGIEKNDVTIYFNDDTISFTQNFEPLNDDLNY